MRGMPYINLKVPCARFLEIAQRFMGKLFLFIHKPNLTAALLFRVQRSLHTAVQLVNIDRSFVHTRDSCTEKCPFVHKHHASTGSSWVSRFKSDAWLRWVSDAARSPDTG